MDERDADVERQSRDGDPEMEGIHHGDGRLSR